MIEREQVSLDGFRETSIIFRELPCQVFDPFGLIRALDPSLLRRRFDFEKSVRFDVKPTTSVPDELSFEGISAPTMYFARKVLTSVITREAIVRGPAQVVSQTVVALPLDAPPAFVTT